MVTRIWPHGYFTNVKSGKRLKKKELVFFTNKFFFYPVVLERQEPGDAYIQVGEVED